MRDGHFIDFTDLKNTVFEDLGKRDFTINAMAWSPDTGIIDPFQGHSDLKRKILKVVRPENLAKDPLRVLRAYRIAAQLDIRIEEGTRQCLKRYSHGLREVDHERTTEEIIKLITCTKASHYLFLSKEDKVLPEIRSLKSRILYNNIHLI